MSYGQIYFNTFRQILRNVSLLWFATRYIKKKNIFVGDLNWATCGLRQVLGGTPEPPQKMFLSENVIFRGLLRLFLGYVGQQAPESPVSQLKNGVSTFNIFFTYFNCGLIDI